MCLHAKLWFGQCNQSINFNCSSKGLQHTSLLLIGWRGSPSQKDEPQHKVKGKITPSLLKLLNIKYCIVKNQKDFKKLNNLIIQGKKKKVIACLVEKNVLNANIKLKIIILIKINMLIEKVLFNIC